MPDHVGHDMALSEGRIRCSVNIIYVTRTVMIILQTVFDADRILEKHYNQWISRYTSFPRSRRRFAMACTLRLLKPIS